jgi:hypothetical protein
VRRLGKDQLLEPSTQVYPEGCIRSGDGARTVYCIGIIVRAKTPLGDLVHSAEFDLDNQVRKKEAYDQAGNVGGY